MLTVSHERSAASGSRQSFVIHSELGIECELFAEFREATSEELTQLGRRWGILFEKLEEPLTRDFQHGRRLARDRGDLVRPLKDERKFAQQRPGLRDLVGRSSVVMSFDAIEPAKIIKPPLVASPRRNSTSPARNRRVSAPNTSNWSAPGSKAVNSGMLFRFSISLLMAMLLPPFAPSTFNRCQRTKQALRGLNPQLTCAVARTFVKRRPTLTPFPNFDVSIFLSEGSVRKTATPRRSRVVRICWSSLFDKAATSPSSVVGLSPTSASRAGPAAYFFVGVKASLARSE